LSGWMSRIPAFGREGEGNRMDTSQRGFAEEIPCRCFINPDHALVVLRELGLDARHAEATLLVCPDCGQLWLRYFYEVEAFKASGRWYRGAITAEQASRLAAETAKDTLEGLDWYFFGGSYFGGRSGRTSGHLLLNP
jgi:hypothetical protein